MESIIDVLLGARMSFQGAHSNRFMLGGCVYEVVEDPDDGYRSSMEDVRVIGFPGHPESLGFPSQPIAMCTLQKCDAYPANKVGYDHYGHLFEGYQLVGDDDHTWLCFGTDNIDDYYPCFIFDYTPKERTQQ